MEDNFFDFSQTKEALSQLSADLTILESEAKAKSSAIIAERQDHDKILAQKDDKIAAMSESIKNATAKIDTITKYIDGVL